MNAKLLILVLASAALLAACDLSTEARVPDTPPLVGLATINGVNARYAPEGYLLAPAIQMYDPNAQETVPNNVPVAITASDERQVRSVAVAYTDGQGHSWDDELTFERDEEIFRNPFTFSVPFRGMNSGLSAAQLEIIVTDDVGQVNTEYSAAVRVDGSLPIVSATVPSEPQNSPFLVYGEAQDPESGVVYIGIFLDGLLFDAVQAGSSYALTIDAAELFVGTHTLVVVALNGVNEAATVLRTFEVIPAEDEEPTTP